jgi:MOSC domain-containing protein
MSLLRLAALTVYPIKSAAGIPSDAWDVDAFGLRYDRRWVVTDPAGVFQTQRTIPRLALIRVALGPGALRLDAPERPTLELPLAPSCDRRVRVRVWNDETEGVPVGPAADRWLTDFLGAACRLVYMPDDVVRPVDPTYGSPGDRVGFADAFPFLLISDASLADLNARLAAPLPMNRFRPNLVVSGCAPYAEDDWGGFHAAGIEFRVVKPCARCVVTTTDQATAARGTEPLRTLATYRRRGNDALFGQNLIHRGTGRLEVGAPVELAR